MIAASLALVYAYDQRASDSVGVTVGSSVDVARSNSGEPVAPRPTARPHDEVDDTAPTDPALAVGSEPSVPDGPGPVATIDDDADPTPPSSRPEPPPSTKPPTAVDLLVDRITVPGTSKATVDGCGDPLEFGARAMTDGVDATTWRMDGDGTGASIVVELEGPRRVLSVGLIPGFDAVDPCDGTDRFATHRRITNVTWEFDDGSRFEQRFIDVATLQRRDVDATTTRIKLHIDGVSADPEADFTAVSELVVRGV